MKKFFALLLVFFLLPVFHTAYAAEKVYYYMLEGREYYGEYENTMEILRIELIEYDGLVERGPGIEYVMVAWDYDENTLYSVPIDVRTRTSDTTSGGAGYGEFITLIPYNPEIVLFIIFGSDGEPQAVETTWDVMMERIGSFSVTESGDGYEMEWNVALYYEDDREHLDFNVTAVSQRTGEKNVLAYRIAENSLVVPYEWLDPNDTVVFVLAANDTRTTLYAESEVFTTPDGNSKMITEEWDDSFVDDDDNDDDDYYYDDDVTDADINLVLWLILTLIIIVFAGGIAVVIIIFVKRGKKKSVKSTNYTPPATVMPKVKNEAPQTPDQVETTVTLKINGATVETDSQAIMHDGRVLVPVRVVAEALGYIAAWSSEKQTIDIYDPDTKELQVNMKIGSDKANVSIGIQGVMDERIMDAPAKLIRTVAYAPAPFVAEMLKAALDWNDGSNTVNIKK